MWLIIILCGFYIVKKEFMSSEVPCAENHHKSNLNANSDNPRLPKNQRRMHSPFENDVKPKVFDDSKIEEPSVGRVSVRIPGTNRKIDHNFPIVFIGGVPRSGTTIMRVIADAHPGIACGEETRVVPNVGVNNGGFRGGGSLKFPNARNNALFKIELLGSLIIYKLFMQFSLDLKKEAVALNATINSR